MTEFNLVGPLLLFVLAAKTGVIGRSRPRQIGMSASPYGWKSPSRWERLRPPRFGVQKYCASAGLIAKLESSGASDRVYTVIAR